MISKRFHVKQLIIILLMLFHTITGVYADNPLNDNGDLIEKKIQLKAAGLTLYQSVFVNADDAMFIPVQNMETGRLMNHFKCRLTHLVPMRTIVLGFRDSADFRMELDNSQAVFGKEKINLKNPPFIYRGQALIPMEALEKAWKVKVGYSRDTGTYYMDPVVTDVVVEEEKEKLKLSVKSTGPVTYKTAIIEDPLRYIIDIDGAYLDDSIADKDLHDKRVGSLFVSQESYNPNRIRVIVPLEMGIEVEMIEKPQVPFNVEAWLFTPQTVAPVQDLKQERVSDLRVQEEPGRVVFKVLTTGPVQYEWRRLLPPDNRYFVDIPNCIYTAPEYTKNFEVGYLKNVNVKQYRNMPDPVVRVTFDLHVPSKINVFPDPKRPLEIRMEVYSETINPRFAERQGFGVTDLPAPGGIVICIDPGHGGGDPGACNSSMGLKEKEINLDISLRLAGMLKKAGWNVVMTRVTDRDVSFAGSSDGRELGDRVKIANQTRADIFVSIHIDASTSSHVNGTSTYYHKSDSQTLAQYVQNALVASNGLRNIGVRQGSFYVIRNTNMPSILVECGFISNPGDASKLATPAFRERCAVGIYNGLVAYARGRGMGTAPAPAGPDPGVVKEIEEKKQEAQKKIMESDKEGSSDYTER